MPKRSCPFVESCTPQLKNHIGLKQINMGVMSQERMDKVYDRTLKMMYEGAQKENFSVADSQPCVVESRRPTILPGQRKLNFHGKLEGCYTSSQGKSHLRQETFLPIACGTCQNIPSEPSTCHFCEKCLCEMCARSCISCSYSFCSDCSTIRYKSGYEEKSLCLSCI